MQEQNSKRGLRGKYARLICHGCTARKIKCVLPSYMNLGPLGAPQSESTSCERCRDLGLECVIERNHFRRQATNRANRAISSQTTKSDRLSSQDPTPQDQESAGLSDSIRQYLFSGVMDDNLMVQSTRDVTKTPFGENDLYHSMTNTNDFVALVLAKDASFGADIQLISTWNACLTDIISHELAIMLDSLLAWQRFFVLGIPSLVSLRERLLSRDPRLNNIATKLLFAVLCLTACTKSKDHFQDASLKEKLQQAVSSLGQDFIFSPPTHTDSIVLCRFLATFKPTTLATSQRVAHQSVKGELYINLAYRVAEQLGILPEPASPSFAGMNAINNAETERNFLLSIQGLQLVADEFLQGNFLSMPLHSFRQVLQRMQPHIHSYDVLMQTTSCSPIMIFHIKWTTATYMQIEAMVEMKQNWMNPSRLFITVEEGEKKCLAEMNTINQFLSGVSHVGVNEQNEIRAIRSFLEIRFHTLISRLFGLGLFYISLLEARNLAGQSKSSADFCQDEVIQMGNVINVLLTTPDNQRNSHFFTFLRHFGQRYPDKLQEILAKFVECTAIKLEYNDCIAPIRPIVLESVNHCKNIMENNLLRFKVSGRLHANFDEQCDLFRQCAQRLATMVSLPGCALDNIVLKPKCIF